MTFRPLPPDYVRGTRTGGVQYRLRIHHAGTVVPGDLTVEFVLGPHQLPDPPSGVGDQVLRILEGRVESQPYSIRVLDLGPEAP